MTDAATLNATARVRQLIDLTERLSARLSAETRAFEARRPQDADRRESAQVKADPGALAPAPVAARKALIEATKAFEAILSTHARAVYAARTVSEGLMRTIAAEVADQRGSPSAYGATGRANAGDGRAVALNRTA